MAETPSSSSYCSAQVRAHDPERFLISLFAADEDREALHALYAFNLELARIAGLVSEPLLGQVRLQWWREAIEGIYAGAPRRHEVVLALSDAVHERGLPREMFETMITGREIELDSEPPGTMKQLESYLRATSGELVAAGLLIVGVGDGDDLMEAGRRAGIARGYLTVIRALRSQAGRHHPLIPGEILSRHGMTPEHIAQGQASSTLPKAIEELSHRAQDHLMQARRLAVRPARRHMAPLLSAALVPSYLGALRSVDYDPFAANYDRGSLGQHLRVLTNAILRRV
jgi:NADH dehydrogenase [ubiquinone] 1 alpha subcomplex assembly factor 6